MKIEKCPFCGGEAKITARDVEPQGDPWYGKNIQTFVICTNCGACLFDDYFHEGFADEHEAIAAWNRRAEPAETIEKLKKSQRRYEEATGWADLLYENFPLTASLRDIRDGYNKWRGVKGEPK